MNIRLVAAFLVLGTLSVQAQDTYQRGDLVRLRTDDGSIVTPTVIAVAGDRLRLDDSGLFVNDVRVAVPPEFLETVKAGWQQTVPAAHYFVMQDAKAPRSVTRFWGLVPAERILGRAVPVELHPREHRPSLLEALVQRDMRIAARRSALDDRLRRER